MTAIHLSPRLQQVLELIAEGHDTLDIAHKLHIGPTTVKSQIKKLFQRFDAINRAQLVHRAHLAGHLAADPQAAEDVALVRQARELGMRIALVPGEAA